MITSKKLLKQKKIRHGFFNRNGGKSNGIYKSLNCGIGSSDNKNKVKKNLKIVKDRISKKAKNIFLIHQVHSNKFVFINKDIKFYEKERIKADAIITNQERLPIAILTADCAPILLYDNKKKMIAAIHAGWKGAFKGIINKVINFMLKNGCKKNQITAAIGPCIKQNSYNVKEDFQKKFIKKDIRYAKFFKSKNKKKSYFNLRALINYQLSELGLKKIYNINRDTYSNENLFFSHRRTTHKRQKTTGRLINLISLS